MVQESYCLKWRHIFLLLLCPTSPITVAHRGESTAVSPSNKLSTNSLLQMSHHPLKPLITTSMPTTQSLKKVSTTNGYPPADDTTHDTASRHNRSLQSSGQQQVLLSGNVQDDDDNNTIRISLSIWAAQLYSEASLLQVLEDVTVQNGIADAVLQVLCSVTDLRLVNRGGTFFETEILDMFDTCRKFSPPRTRRRMQQETASTSSSSTNPMPAVVSAWHKTAVMLRVSDEILFSTWTFAFPVLRVGQLYIEEAMMNNQGISITEIGDAAVEALEQVSQLALDVSMMEGTLDEILHNLVDAHILYASPVLQETTMFRLAALDYTENFQFHPRFIYPMRVCGVLMLLSSITVYAMLRFAARLRRSRIEHETFKLQLQVRGDAPSVVHFRDRSGVENLLEQSATAGLVTRTMVTSPMRNNNNNNSSNTTATTGDRAVFGCNVPVLDRLRAEQVRRYRYNGRHYSTYDIESTLDFIEQQDGTQNSADNFNDKSRK